MTDWWHLPDVDPRLTELLRVHLTDVEADFARRFGAAEPTSPARPIDLQNHKAIP